jgi:hypothetical protein
LGKNYRPDASRRSRLTPLAVRITETLPPVASRYRRSASVNRSARSARLADAESTRESLLTVVCHLAGSRLAVLIDRYSRDVSDISSAS